MRRWQARIVDDRVPAVPESLPLGHQSIEHDRCVAQLEVGIGRKEPRRRGEGIDPGRMDREDDLDRIVAPYRATDGDEKHRQASETYGDAVSTVRSKWAEHGNTPVRQR